MPKTKDSGVALERDMAFASKKLREAVKSGLTADDTLVKREISTETIKGLTEARENEWKKVSILNAQDVLLERYRVDKKLGVVNNTIDEVISDEIFKIREAINNMISYGDYRVFKVLPEELMDKINVYGMVAQKYFGEKMLAIKNEPVYIVPVSFHYCTRCCKFKGDNSFYISSSDTCNGYTHVCKDCANELFKGYFRKYKDIKESLILISHKLDLYVYEPTLRKYVDYFKEADGKHDLANNSFLGKYIGDLGVQKSYNANFKECNFEDSNFEGVPFKCVVNYFAVPQIYNDKFMVEVAPNVDDIDKEISDDDKELSQYLIKKLEYKFGKYSAPDLKWLERRYREWDEAYDISALNTKKLITQMCCDELSIVHLRETGADVSKQWKSFMETMKTLSLTPKQQAKDSKSSGFSSISEFIKEVEKRKPIVNKDPEFEDVDKVKRFVIGISGAISRTLGRTNKYSDAFEEIFSEYSSSVLDTGSGDEDEES